jgi:hypothetical protein
MPGNLGVSPGSAVTNFPPGIVGPPGVIHAGDSRAAGAQLANTAAFLALSAGDNFACTTDYGGVTKELGGLTLVPGVYCADAFQITGALYLDASSDPNGVWIFRAESSTGNTAAGDTSSVQWVEGGVGSPCNVWWKIASSMTIGTGTSFIGNILALTSISLATNASLDGRAMAQTGAVTLDSNTITGAECLTPETPRRKVGGLPNSGGAPIRNQDLPWSLLIIGGISAIALVFGVRQYRITKRSK